MEPRDDPPPYSPPLRAPVPNVVRPPKIFGPHPMPLTCTNCHQLVTTSMAHEYGSCTIIATVIMFLFCFPCFWIPLVIDTCKDVHHMCPSCNALVGTHKIL